MRPYKNNYNATKWPQKKQLFTLPSRTVPDQTMSVSEIMRRYAHGLPLDGQRVGFYEGDDSFTPDPKTLDLVDIQEMKQQNAENIQNITKKLNTKQKQTGNGEAVVPPTAASAVKDTPDGAIATKGGNPEPYLK